MKLLWSNRSKNDLLEIAKYIAQDNPAAARRWIEKLRIRARSILEMPLAGRVVPEFSQQNIREILQSNYRIVYLVKANQIIILTVFEGHRLMDENLEKDF